MCKEFLTVILVPIALISFTLYLLLTIEKEKNQCNDLGGVYINSQCFKAEIIKLD